MIIDTKIGKLYGQKDEYSGIYSILSINYARAERFEYPTLIQDYDDKEKFINREGTFAFPQKSYPLFMNVFLKHFMLRPEFLPIKDQKTEDAFVINIWTDGFEEKKPVLVFIHGGGEGSGTVPMYTMKNLAKKGLVAVSITYRIGNFGYMPTWEGENFSANLAYFDQQKALEWIRKNIGYFGGDEENITLMGHCAGGLAALYHYLNPISNKLFDKLIICCGNLPMLKSLDQAKKTYYQMLKDNKINSREELKKMPKEKFMKIRKGQNDVLDGKFFTKDPLQVIQDLDFPEKPILIGSNQDEFSMIEIPIYYKFLGIAKKEKDLKNTLNKKYGKYAERLEESFKPLSKDHIDLQIQIMELNIFHSSALYLMENFSKKCPVYGYRLNEVPNLYDGLRGAYHGAELAFFFGNLDKMNIEISEENKRARDLIQKDWLDFVKRGKIEGRVLFNEKKEISLYENQEVTTIRFPQADLIDDLYESGIFEKEMADYIDKR